MDERADRDRGRRLPSTAIGVKRDRVEGLKPTAPLHPTAGPELEALSVDPLTFGNVQGTFARFVYNGETLFA